MPLIRPATLILLLLLVGPPCLAQPVPQLLNYQGRISTPDSLLNANVELTFGVFISESAATPLWQETHQVTTEDGVFGVLLGGVAPFPNDLFQNETLYLSTTVLGRELLPRQRLVSVAYALRAGEAEAFTGPILKADSLVIGDRPVVDSGGNWQGGRFPGAGLGVDSLVSIVYEDSISFTSDSDWRLMSNSGRTIDVVGPATLDIQFTATIATLLTSIETRLIHRLLPSNTPLGPAGNVAVVQPGNTLGSTIHSHAILRNLDTGSYRFLLEVRSPSRASGVLRTGVLVVRIFR